MITLIYDLFNEIFKTGKWGVTVCSSSRYSFRIWSLVGRYILQNSNIDREKISFKSIHIVVVAIHLDPH